MFVIIGMAQNRFSGGGLKMNKNMKLTKEEKAAIKKAAKAAKKQREKAAIEAAIRRNGLGWGQ